MRAGQLKTRLRCVVEAPKWPAVGIVALFASCPEPPLVMVVLMARTAGSRCSLEPL